MKRNIKFSPILLLASIFSGQCLISPLAWAVPPAPENAYSQSQTVEQKAKAALAAGNTKAATQYALQMLNGNTAPTAWYYGNTIDEANQILGLAALKEGRRADAKKYLIAAGKTPGSPQLNSFGPQMVLAQQLLAKGETTVVIQYLDLVARFWAYTPPAKLQRFEKQKPGSSKLFVQLNQQHAQQIVTWKRQIRAGEKPQLNMSASLL